MASVRFELETAEQETLDHEPYSDAPPADMPHLEHSSTDLGVVYPSIVPPDDEAFDDTQDDGDDCVLQHGLRLAERLRQDTASQGRKRRATQLSANGGSGGSSGGSNGQPLHHLEVQLRRAHAQNRAIIRPAT